MRRTAVRVASLALSLVLLAVLAGMGLAVSQLHAAGPSTEEVTVVLPRGAGLSGIAAALEAEGVVADAGAFALWVRFAADAGALRAGEYRFPAGVSAPEAARMLAEGRTLQRRFTVPEGLTAALTLALLADAEGMEGALPPGVAEGSLLPETYHYEWGESRAAMVVRMQHALEDLLAGLWAERAEGLPLEVPRDAVILASIVERETGVAAERARIAGVFLNRLRRGMRLQSDPTVLYGLDFEGREDGPLTREELEADHPYNTYRVTGLPPGPIANPGRASLEAVLHPAATDELYFVADGNGGHVFAVTLEEHNRNAARYRSQQQAP